MEKKATKRVSIKNDADARAYLATQDYNFGRVQTDERGDFVTERITCSRCGGAGYYPSQFHGACFECGGRPPNYIKRTALVDVAKSFRRSELASNRRQAKNDARQEAFDAERAERRAPFDADFPGFRAELAPYLPLYNEDEGYNVPAKTHRILNDMAGKLEKYGSISEKAVEFARKLLADEAAPKATLEEGRRVLTGKVVKAMWKSNDFGESMKMVLDLTDEDCRVYGSVPMALQYSDLGRRLRKGDIVTLTAKVERSEDKTDFGFFARPSKASVIEAAPEDAPDAVDPADAPGYH